MPQITCDQCAFWRPRVGGRVVDAMGACVKTIANKNNPKQRDTMAIAIAIVEREQIADGQNLNTVLRTHRKYSCPMAEKGENYE